MRYWSEWPPLHVLVKGLAEGFSGKKLGKKIAETNSKFVPSTAEEILQGLGTGG